MATCLWYIEIDFGAGYVDVTGDVIALSIGAKRGIAGNKPEDRVASIGRMTFELDNSATNSGGKLGYYSLGHANVRSGFSIGNKVRLKLYDGTTVKTKWTGRIKSVLPNPGTLENRRSVVTAGDWWDRAARHFVSPSVATQINKRPDELIVTVVNDMSVAPAATSIDTDQDTLPLALDDVKEETKTMGLLQRIVKTSVGYLYSTGDDTLVYETRHTRLKPIATAGTLAVDLNSIRAGYSDEEIYNDISVTANPQFTDASPVVLASLQQEISVPPNGEITFTLTLQDPNNPYDSISLYSGSEQAPEANTDFKMSSIYGNDGNDLNDDCTLTPTWGSSVVSVRAQNSASVIGYINKCDLRGRGIYKNRPVTMEEKDDTSIEKYERLSLQYDMPYQSNVNVAKSLAGYLLYLYKNEKLNINTISFQARRSNYLAALAVSLEIGDKIELTDSMTGFSAVEYFVNGIEYRIRDGDIEVVCVVEAASTVDYWILGTSELGVNTTLAW